MSNEKKIQAARWLENTKVQKNKRERENDVSAPAFAALLKIPTYINF